MRSALIPAIGSVLFGAGLVAVGLAGEPGRRTVAVEMREFAFAPARIEAQVGDTIEWLNRDALPHTATAVDGAWSSREMGAGARWSRVVDQAGTIEYLCAYHPGMRGTIVVRD